MRTAILTTVLLGMGCSSSSSDAAAALDGGADTNVADASSSDGGDADAPHVDCTNPSTSPDAPCGAVSFAASDVKSRLRNHHVTFLANTKAGPFLYVIAGVNGSKPLKNVNRFPLGKDGSLSASNDEAAMPVARGGLTGGVVGSVIVVAGGTNGGSVTNLSYTAVIGDDGALAPWAVGGSVLHPRMHPGAVVKGDSVYVLGGFADADVWDDVVSAKVSPGGTLSAWTSAGKLPAPRSHFAVTRVGEYAYLTGGLNQPATSDPPFLKTTFRGRFLADGTLGEWTPMPALPVTLATHASFFYGGRLFACGGISGTKQESRCWSSPIGADHTLGAWEAAPSLVVARGHVHQLPVFGNHVYSIAGAVDFSLNSTDEIDVGTFE